jgi:hypothetical protein
LPTALAVASKHALLCTRREILLAMKQTLAGRVPSQQDGRMMNSTRLAHGAIADQSQVK